MYLQCHEPDTHGLRFRDLTMFSEGGGVLDYLYFVLVPQPFLFRKALLSVSHPWLQRLA